MQSSLSYLISSIYVHSSCVYLFVQSVPRRLRILLFILHEQKSGCNSPYMCIYAIFLTVVYAFLLDIDCFGLAPDDS